MTDKTHALTLEIGDSTPEVVRVLKHLAKLGILAVNGERNSDGIRMNCGSTSTVYGVSESRTILNYPGTRFISLCEVNHDGTVHWRAENTPEQISQHIQRAIRNWQAANQAVLDLSAAIPS